MLQEDRYLKIIDYLKENPIATFAELSQLTGASIGTVRRDLTNLEANDALSVVRGGAAARRDDISKQAFDIRGIEHRDEKREIAQLLTNVVINGQAIAINSGTTNMEVAHFLVNNYKRLTVVTNNFRIVDILKQAKNFTVVVPGGIFDAEEYALYGKECERQISSYNFDVAILAVNAISENKGITDFRVREIGIMRSIIEASKTKVVVADYSKFDRIAYMNVCEIDKIDYILSDSNLTEEQIGRYSANNLKVIVPKMGGLN